MVDEIVEKQILKREEGVVQSPDSLLASEWLLNNSSEINVCPDGTKISKKSCKTRHHRYPHTWVDNAGKESLSGWFAICRQCKHYKKFSRCGKQFRYPGNPGF